jgi:hypothetical protein
LRHMIAAIRFCTSLPPVPASSISFSLSKAVSSADVCVLAGRLSANAHCVGVVWKTAEILVIFAPSKIAAILCES